MLSGKGIGYKKNAAVPSTERERTQNCVVPLCSPQPWAGPHRLVSEGLQSALLLKKEEAVGCYGAYLTAHPSESAPPQGPRTSCISNRGQEVDLQLTQGSHDPGQELLGNTTSPVSVKTCLHTHEGNMQMRCDYKNNQQEGGAPVMWPGPCGPQGCHAGHLYNPAGGSTMSTQGAGIGGGYLSRRW